MQVASITKRKVLVIDDNAEIFTDFQLILCQRSSNQDLNELESRIFADEKGSTSDNTTSEYNYDLSYASQGKEGLEVVKKALAENDPFHLAFVDMRMPPGWDGLQTIIKLWEVDPCLQIVICTAYSDQSWEEIQDCVQDYSENLLILKKPFDQAEVAQCANALVKKWWLAREASLQMNQLQQMVDEQTQEIVNAQQMAERAEKAKSDFFQGICQKISPNLESILDFCDEMGREKLNETQGLHLSRIQTTSKNLLTMIEDLLEVSQLDVTEEV